MAGVGVDHVQVLVDYLALVDSTGFQLRIAADFTKPSDIRELERCVPFKVALRCRSLNSGRDDLTKATGAKLMLLTDSPAVYPGLERILLELAIPDEMRERIDGAPLVGSCQE